MQSPGDLNELVAQRFKQLKSARKGTTKYVEVELSVEVGGVDTGLGAPALHESVVPEPRDADIEHAAQALIDGLDAGSRHRPLPADPEDIAMQGHERSVRIDG